MVTVLGDAMLDRLFIGPVTRMSPEASWAPVIDCPNPELRLGGAGFVARALRKLGENVRLCAAKDGSYEGLQLGLLCEKEGIDALWAPADRTTVKSSVIADDGCRQVPLVRVDGDASSVADYNSEALCPSYWGSDDVIVIADYNKGFVRSLNLPDILEFAMAREIPVIADPKPANIGWLRGCDVALPNIEEAQSVTGCDDPRDMIRSIKYQYGFGAVVITLSDQGAVGGEYVDDGMSLMIREVPAREFGQVKSVSGAGDVFTAGMAYQMARGVSALDAMEFAEKVARHYVYTGEIDGNC